MVSIESEPLARPRRLPPDHSCEKRERLLVVEQKNIFSAPKEVWVVAPPVGVLCQHIKREYLCRQRSQHYRHSLVLRPSSHAGWQPPAAEIQPNAETLRRILLARKWAKTWAASNLQNSSSLVLGFRT